MMPLLDVQRLIHVRVAGRSYDLPAEQLGLPADCSDAQLKQSVSRFLELPANQLTDTVIDRHANGNITVRPQAVFG